MLLYKFRGVDSDESIQRLKDILTCERLYCAPWYCLNDPVEGTYRNYFGRTKDGRRMYTSDDLESICSPEDGIPRVCSMSARFDHMLLWSHYASGCSGFAVEIDFTGFAPPPHSIEYTDEIIEVHEDAREFPGVRQLLSRKKRLWDYEAEYRIITFDESLQISGRIRRVIAGPRCPNVLIEQIGSSLPSGAVLHRGTINDCGRGIEVGRRITGGTQSPT